MLDILMYVVHPQLVQMAQSISELMMVTSMQSKGRGNLAIPLGLSFAMTQKILVESVDLNSEDNNLLKEPGFRVVKKKNLGANP